MDSTNIYLQKLACYLDNPGQDELKREIDSWRAASPQNEKAFQEYYRIWSTAAELQVLAALDAEKRPAPPLAGRVVPMAPIPPANTGRRKIRWLWNAAAVLILGAAGYWMYTRAAHITYAEKTTSTNTIDSIIMADGSKIFLDANTHVKYPIKMTGPQYTVQLMQGNAFFQVAANAKRSFIVMVDQSSITVLGTSFNIHATGSDISLSVKTGKVMFTPTPDNEKTMVNAGSGVVYNKLTRTITRFDAVNANNDAWITQELVFVDAPLQEVCKKLEAHYKVKITIVGNISSLGKLNVTFNNNKLEEVLDVLKETYPISIVQKADHIIIKK
ncbi:FecR domain-containing protein [Chitinophaga defluvii]|uniref:FecR domain-containing protein n=1 Tax=Chitinophaga defluvii TaxID=3163343 RepID=A0ABV2TBB5_9BACT